MSRQESRIRSGAKVQYNLESWLIMLPGLLLMAFFVWEPLFESIRMSLYKTRNVELVRFIGLDNFISVIGKDDFLQALRNTFSYTFWSLLIGFLLPILLAMLIGETTRGKSLFRTAVYLPNMLPGLAVIILWSAFFSGEKSGVMNILLGMMDDGYGDIGKMMGFLIARFIEKKWIRFEPLKNRTKSVIFCLIGLIPMVILTKYFSPFMKNVFGPHWGKLFFSILYTCYYIALFPLILKLIGKSEDKAETA